MIHRTARALGLVALTALALTACAATSSVDGMTSDSIVSDGGPMRDEATVGDVGAAEAPAADTTAATVQDRMVIRTAYVSVRVGDVARSAAEVRALIARSQGFVSTEDARVDGESPYATITAQVPSGSLDAFLASVGEFGTVESVSVSAQDVTAQTVDLDARITSLRASVDRMNVLLAEAERIEDLLAIETQVSQRQAELDSLVAQRTWLGDQVAMSTVTVSLTPESDIAVVEAPGFVSGLVAGWNALVSAAGVAATTVGFLLPFATILVVVGLVILLVLWQRRRRGQSTRSGE